MLLAYRPGVRCSFSHCFFFNATATTEIYTLSLHDALPISIVLSHRAAAQAREPYPGLDAYIAKAVETWVRLRSEEHTSELQSRQYLVCRLLLEKKKHKPQQDQHHERLRTQLT